MYSNYFSENILKRFSKTTTYVGIPRNPAGPAWPDQYSFTVASIIYRRVHFWQDHFNCLARVLRILDVSNL